MRKATQHLATVFAVKDIHASRVFYAKLGFKVFMGDASQNWLILKNGKHVIGLFQGMFERISSPLTLAGIAMPGYWDTFTDVRELQ
jgi:predicted lactoylglutathione lyase